VQDLDGDLAVEEVVVAGVDDAHAAAADHLEDGEAADLHRQGAAGEQGPLGELAAERVVLLGRGDRRAGALTRQAERLGVVGAERADRRPGLPVGAGAGPRSGVARFALAVTIGGHGRAAVPSSVAEAAINFRFAINEGAAIDRRGRITSISVPRATAPDLKRA
jgi:hypothetical protein